MPRLKWWHYLLIFLVLFYIIKNFKLPEINLGGRDWGAIDPNATGSDCPLPQKLQDWNISKGNPPCEFNVNWM